MNRGTARKAPLGVPLMVALAVALSPAPAVSLTPVFASTTVASERFIGQPAVAVDRSVTPNPIYVAATDYSVWDCCTFARPMVTPVGERALIWRSLDGGQSFQGPAASAGGGGQSDIAVDARGAVFVVELFDTFGRETLPISASGDRGQSFAFVGDANSSWNPFFNQCYTRPWIAAEGVGGHVVVTAQCGDEYRGFVGPANNNNFFGPFTIATGIRFGGRPAFSPADGKRVYAAYTTFTQVRVARSTDGGQTWNSVAVAAIPGKELTYPSVAVATPAFGDDEVYVVWSEEASEISPAVVKFSASTNEGGSWSAAKVISDPKRTSLFPSVTAGAAGKVDVAYYAARNPGGVDPGADLGHPLTSWDVVVAQSLNANLPGGRTFARTVAVSGFHTGSVCTIGLCLNELVEYPNAPVPIDGRVGDFFGLDSDSAGNAIFAYPKDRSITQNLWSAIDLMLGRQTGGSAIR